MNISESKRKYILLGIVAFIVIGLITAKVLASKQDEQFLNDDLLYQQAGQLLQEGNVADASIVVKELLESQPQSEMVNYLAGMIAAQTEDYKQSAILFQKTLDINPHKVEDAMFMLQFGEILVLAERYDDAKVVLERCRAGGWAPEEFPTYQERVTELLTQIENK